LRVIIANKVGPVLLIAFTNHALDHMLASVLDANITNRIVRLGSRSADERVSEYSIEKLMGRAPRDRIFGRQFRRVMELEQELTTLIGNIIRPLNSSDIVNHISIQYPAHASSLRGAPNWIHELHARINSADGGSWEVAGSTKSRKRPPDKSMYSFWRDGTDIDFLRISTSSPSIHIEFTSEPVLPVEFFRSYGYATLPSIPSTDAGLEHLRDFFYDLWDLSLAERNRLHDLWAEETRLMSSDTRLNDFVALRAMHAQARGVLEDMREEVYYVFIESPTET
jgi:hypothetical protein